MWIAITGEDKANALIDKPISIKCPHCHVPSNLSAISVPKVAQMKRYDPSEVVIGFRCDACTRAIGLRFKSQFESTNRSGHLLQNVYLSAEFDELERPMETFDYEHLPEPVAADLREVLTAYSHACPNATAAMCRRTLQSVATDLGAVGTAKVQKQLLEAKETAGIDDDTYDGLVQIMLVGHEGAHPHLPLVSNTRAAVLVEILKDVLTQIYIRSARIKESMRLRQEAIEQKREAE